MGERIPLLFCRQSGKFFAVMRDKKVKKNDGA
jgi:hypothetical protein